jgi:hypothetical protein
MAIIQPRRTQRAQRLENWDTGHRAGRLSVGANLRISNWWEPFPFLSSGRRVLPFFIGVANILCGLCVLCGKINSCFVSFVTFCSKSDGAGHSGEALV